MILSKDYKDGKYVVFKKEEFDQWWGQGSVGGTKHNVPAPEFLDDTVVIRLQDVFAGPALAAYANSISVAIEAMRMDQPFNQEVIDHLQRVADYFSEQAEEAFANLTKKLPD